MENRAWSKDTFHIVVASDSNLLDFVHPCIDSIKKHKYDPTVYDLGGLGFGVPFRGATTSEKPLHKFPQKPRVILDKLKTIDSGHCLAWIDADCIMIDQIHDIQKYEFDIAVTFRKNHMNTGVVFVRHTPEAIRFLEEWIKVADEVGGDQNGINRILKLTRGSCVGMEYNYFGAKVRPLDARIWNNFFFKKSQEGAKVLHYKSKFRYRFPFYKKEGNDADIK